jgi:molybdate transport system substrate-binding protein
MIPRFRSFLRLACALLLLPLAGSCAPQTEAGPVVLAAASLTEALEQVADAWAADGHARPVLSFAGTPALARQVEGGAPADIVVFADTQWMDVLARRGLIDPATRRDLLGNRLVLVKPAGGPSVTLETLGEGRLALADPGSVPAGRYARASLESLGLWSALAGRVVPAENVRAALALVERGEVELGIVYASDALVSDGVEQVASLPADSHPPIRYPVAVLAASEHRDSASFAAFLSSEEALAIFSQHGFEAGR